MEAFSQFYDLMVGTDHKYIVNFIDNAIKKYKKDSELVCDLGCGTATVTTSLSAMGYDMIGIDSSEDMLIRAREKAQKAGDSSILFLNQDITDFELYGTVDVIYSTLDTINYITDKRSLNRLLYLVKNYLNFDGLFIFDINTKYKFEKILKNSPFIYDFDNLFATWESEKLPNDVYNHYLTYFTKNKSDTYDKTIDVQTQRFYDKKYINDLIKKYDFEILSVVDNYTTSLPNKNTERLTYIVKTNKK